jgi:Clp amino terminal domain, pathogenicity island component
MTSTSDSTSSRRRKPPASSVSPAAGSSSWPRAAAEAWAAAHPDRGPLHPGLQVPPVGERSRQVWKVVDLAAEEARALHHTWISEDHLVLALLHPDCPGAAPAVLASFGVTAAPLRAALVASMGDPYQPHHRGVTLPPATQLVLERANLEALALADAEVASEHVLLALTGHWDGCFATGWLRRHGVEAAAVRQRVVDLTEGAEPPAPVPLPADEPALPAEWDPAPGLELAPNPDGRDPRRRRPWGSAVFVDADGRTFRYGIALRQYFIDRDGHPVLTADGRPVHMLVNEHGDEVRDSEGRRIGPVEIPPGCRVKARHERESWQRPLRCRAEGGVTRLLCLSSAAGVWFHA